MKRLIYLLPIIAILFLNKACYYDSEENLFPELSGNCDTININFTDNIKIIMENRCLSCHSNSTAASFGNNIRLEDYADVSSQFDIVLASVNHEAGYSPMPKNSGKLTNCELNQLSAWAADGKPEN